LLPGSDQKEAWMKRNLRFGLAGVVILCSAGMLSCAGGSSTGSSSPPPSPSATPALSSVNPSSGTAGPSTPVTLTGTNFLAGATVNVSGTRVTVSDTTVVSSSQITATFTIAPSAPTGSYTVTVTTAAGTSNSLNFTVNALPPSTISEQIIVVGHTNSTDFPLSNAAFPNYFSSTEGFVTSLRLTTSSGITSSQLTFSTYFGGTAFEQVRDAFVDAQGNVFITGRTTSTDLPTTAGVFQRNYGGGPQDAFVAKFSATGQLLFATYMGGSKYDVG
jgi:hypothetical protein